MTRWHVSCRHFFRNRKQMATRVKMLKLLQEVRGHTDFTNRRPLPKRPEALFVPVRPGFGKGGTKRSLRIDIQDPPDIPHPVKIIFLNQKSGPAGSRPCQRRIESGS